MHRHIFKRPAVLADYKVPLPYLTLPLKFAIPPNLGSEHQASRALGITR
jgi:hypothetical protein